jgi:MarR family transcriptional regulator, organic hydroperoxide resistance regulator
VNIGSVVLDLQRATHAVLQQLAVDLVGLDLTPSEINALGNLSDGVARTVSELGAAMGSRPTTLTGVLDRLERRGLVTRGPHPGDRRAVVIALTPDGVRTAQTVRTTLGTIERRAVSDLDAAAIAGFRTVVAALIAGAQ